MPLRCPACADVMSTFDAGPVVFDSCRTCGSLWVDSRELSSVPDAPKAIAGLGGLLKNPRHCVHCHATVAGAVGPCRVCSKPTAACPVCRDRPLRAVIAGPGTLDACPRCHGVWIPAAELAELGRSGSLHVRLEEALTKEDRSTARAPCCGRCGSPLRGRTAWRHGKGILCSTCVTESTAGSRKTRSRKPEPGLAVIEILGQVLEFIEGGLPTAEGMR